MKQDKSNCNMYIWEVPVEEAARVVEAYKYKHDIPSEGYVNGFQDGIEYTKTLYENAITEKLKHLRGFSTKDMNAISVEWLREQLDKYECSTYEGIETVLELWETENETN